MIQSGTLYTVNSTGNPTSIPIKGAWIRFTQSGAVKAQIQTNKSTGKYSVDVPLGKYVVELAVGSTTSYPRAAQEFELKTADKADTFQKWLYAKSGDVNDALLKSFKAVLDAANLAATNAKQSETNAKKAVDDFNANTIGSGKVMKEGAYGVGQKILGYIKNLDLKVINESGFYNTDSSSINTPRDGRWWSVISTGGGRAKIVIRTSGGGNQELWVLTGSAGTTEEYAQAYLTNNTAVDSNGFIKKASPVIKLFDDRIEHNGQFANEPVFEKIDTGIYKISNTLGLAVSDESGSWYIQPPKDRNDDVYFNIEWFQNDNKDVEIHVFERLLEQYERNGKTYLRYVNGEPRDIAKHERWIDLRFHEQIDEAADAAEDIELTAPSQ